jgi:hypothetical protein
MYRQYYEKNADAVRARARDRYANDSAYRERRKKYQDERYDYIAQHKLASGCVDCDYVADHRALQLDHVNGVKYKNLSSMRNHSWEKIQEELSKCEVRCANCHAIATVERRATSSPPNS